MRSRALHESYPSRVSAMNITLRCPRVWTEPRRWEGYGFVIQRRRLQHGGVDGRPVLALERAVGGNGTVHAQELARARAERRSAGHLRYPVRAHLRLPLARLPGSVWSANDRLQPLQSLVPPQLLAGDADRAGQERMCGRGGSHRQHLCQGSPLGAWQQRGLARKASARHAAGRPPRSTSSPMSSAALASSC